MITLEGERITRSDPHRHKYSSAIAEYIDCTAGARMGYDTSTGESDAPMGFVSLHGKRIMFSDSRGFVSVDTYPEVSAARQVFDAIDAWYGEWADEDYVDNADDVDTEADEAEANHIERVMWREQYTRYVIACATENLTAHSHEMWIVHGKPTDALGSVQS